MYYVYVLYSKKDRKLYTGSTNNLIKRIKRHNKGLVISTKNRRPLQLIYYEASLTRTEAVKRENYLKSNWGKRYLKNRLKDTLKVIQEVPER